MRLNRFLAATGITSRRGADELIAAGRVTVNGKPCTDFHFQPGPTDHVKVDGKLIHQRAPVHILLNKPRGFVCTRRDPHIMDTIYDLLPSEFSSLAYVGRLDAQSEGLLLLTNDGELTQRLTHPRFKIEKEYEVGTRSRGQSGPGTAITSRRTPGWKTRPRQTRAANFANASAHCARARDQSTDPADARALWIPCENVITNSDGEFATRRFAARTLALVNQARD